MHDPFFILYDARSGSTFLSNLLMKETNVLIPPESNFLTKIIKHFKKDKVSTEDDLCRMLSIIYRDPKFHDWRLSRHEAYSRLKGKVPSSLRAMLLHLLSSMDKKKQYQAIGIKKGSYMHYARQIQSIFPESCLICLIRDGRAVFNSKKHSIYSVTGRPFETNPVRAAGKWRRAVRIMRRLEKEHNALVIHYEELVRSPETVLKRIMKHIDLRPEAGTRFHVNKRYGKMHANIIREAMDSRIDAWKDKLSQKEVFLYERAAGRTLVSEGYSLLNQPKVLSRPIQSFIKRIGFALARK